MKLTLTTAMLALAIAASPAAARSSQPGNPNSPTVSDHRSATTTRDSRNSVARFSQPGNPNSAIIWVPRKSAPPAEMAMMMSCCPEGAGKTAEGHN